MKIELSDDAFRLIKEVFFRTTIEAKNAKAYAYVQDELGRAEAGWKDAQKPDVGINTCSQQSP